MPSPKMTMLWINLIGGIAVLGSYAWGLGTQESLRSQLWGGVPVEIRPLYTVSMCLATVGYFLFSYFIFFRVESSAERIPERVSIARFNVFYLLVLIPSALWMPLTSVMLESPSDGLWWLIRLTLAVVGIASLGMLVCIVASRPTDAKWSRRLAIIGSAAFFFQTGILDALVWPEFFPH